MDEGPKLYDHKPKKAKMKKVKGIDVKSAPAAVSSYYSTGSSANNSGSGGGGNGGSGVSKPVDVPKESFARRYKYMWPLLLTVNIAVGAYLFMRTKKKDIPIEEIITNATPTSTATATPTATATATATPTATPTTSIAPPTTTAVTENLPVAPPTRVLEPIPVMQQKELYKWMLEEKRKTKTNDPVEKKRIDEEKAILKQFIQAKYIPNL